MSRPSSPNLDNPFDTPTSTRPPSVLHLSPPAADTGFFLGSTNGNEQTQGVALLFRPSTTTSLSSGNLEVDAVASGVRYHPTQASTSNSSLSAISDSAGNGITIVPQTASATQQPFTRSMLNTGPNSAHSTSIAVNMPSSALAPLPAKQKAQRMPSHLIPEGVPLPKPWTEKPHRRARIAYFVTYAMILVGFAGGVVQSYFKYAGAQLDRQPLCLVFHEDFDSEDAVFGANGTFQREVSMDGFG